MFCWFHICRMCVNKVSIETIVANVEQVGANTLTHFNTHKHTYKEWPKILDKLEISRFLNVNLISNSELLSSLWIKSFAWWLCGITIKSLLFCQFKMLHYDSIYTHFEHSKSVHLSLPLRFPFLNLWRIWIPNRSLALPLFFSIWLFFFLLFVMLLPFADKMWCSTKNQKPNPKSKCCFCK